MRKSQPQNEKIAAKKAHNTCSAQKRTPPTSARRLALFLLILTLCAGLSSWLIHREMRRVRLNARLITAIKRYDTTTALQLLEAGADGTARDADTTTLRDALAHLWDRLFHRSPQGSGPVDGKRPTALLLFYATIEQEEDQSSLSQVRRNSKLALALVDAGAPVEDQDDKGRTILSLAVMKRHHEVVRRLLAGNARVDTVDSSGDTPLMKADAVDTRALLDHGADMERKNKEGVTALFDADADKTEVLLQHGAKIDAVDRDGNTPLLAACREYDNDDDRKLLMLLKHGADLHVSDKMSIPLLRAAGWCRLETLQALVQRGADPLERDDNGTTTLMISIDNPDERVFHWLLDQGIDVNAVGIDKNAALSIARQRQEEAAKQGGEPQNRYVALVRLLKSRGAREMPRRTLWYGEDGDPSLFSHHAAKHAPLHYTLLSANLT